MPRTVTADVRRSAAWDLTVSGRRHSVDQPQDELAVRRALPGSYGPRGPSRRGQSLEHLTALTDGLFAVAMTLLVLDLRVPAAAAYSEHGLGRALAHLGPSF